MNQEPIEVALHYAQSSALAQDKTQDTLRLSANLAREKVAFKGKCKDPILLRETLLSLYEVVSSDFRYKPKDRSAYLAYQALKKQQASASTWEARQAYFDWLERNDPDAWLILDPVVSVDSTQLHFEVFSKDEGAYARLSLSQALFEQETTAVPGTTNIDFSEDLARTLGRMRSFRETHFDIQSTEVKVETQSEAQTHQTLEKKVKLPPSWLRGFLQVQSASLMSQSHFSLAPMDLYNVLRHLRLNKDQKKGGRAIRIELMPGQKPLLVLEPWGEIFETQAAPYTGQRPEIIRLWGRRRLKVLGRLLPLADTIELHLLGSGMPSYIELEGEHFNFTLALTGFNASNWSQSLAFDLLLPRHETEPPQLPALLSLLSQKGPTHFEEIGKALKLSEQDTLSLIQSGSQLGHLMAYHNTCYLRPLLDQPLGEALRFRNPRERQAYELLAQKNHVVLEHENHTYGQGLTLVGKVKEGSRQHHLRLEMGIDGRVFKAECSCAFFRKHQLKEGPCEHLMALRLYYGQIQQKRNATQEREHIRVETRHYSKRESSGKERFYQLSLHETRLNKRWSFKGRERKQALVFNTAEAARKAYFQQVDHLEAQGFLDIRS